MRSHLESLDGIACILEGRTSHAGLDHSVLEIWLPLRENAWFSYYFWDDDEKAPEFARCIDIHRKHGYDPAELYVDPTISFPSLKAARKLIAKKLGFRIHMDLIPLDASLVKGSHGIVPKNQLDWPVIFGPGIPHSKELKPTEIHRLILNHF